MFPRILCVLSPVEWATFFPGPMAAELRGLGEGVRCVDPLGLDDEAWRELLSDFRPEIVVAAWKTPPLPPEVIGLTDGALRYVCYLAGSVRKLISSEMLEAGLIVTNWGNVISRVVAECGLMLAIAALRRVGHWQLAMHSEGAWKSPETVTGSLFERRIGFHGFGAIAQALARLLVPFEVRMAAYSPNVPDGLLREFEVERAGSLEALFSENDIIIELAALTPENEGIVTEELLRRIPSGGAFINIGRGAVVDEAALARVAAEGEILVGLDVYGEEPLPADSPFRGLRNVVLLPHLGGPTTDRRQDSGRLALRNLRVFLDGREAELEAVISPGVYARST
jgi:phosphoglycerate dehydrogenase-like enzyme